MKQPSPDEQRNLILAAVLSFGVIVLWQIFYVNPDLERQRLEAEQAAKVAAEQPQQPSAADAIAGSAGGAPFAGQVLDRKAALAATPRAAIETPSVRGSISLRGGLIDELMLLKHREELDPNSPAVELLWPRRTQKAYFASFGWSSLDGDAATPTGGELWAVAPGSPQSLKPGSPITLVWDNGGGLVFRREIAVDERYLFTVTQSVENRSGAPVNLIAQADLLRYGTPESEGMWISHEGPVGVVDGSLKEVDYSDLAEDPLISRDDSSRGRYYEVTENGWLGFTDKYWMAALAPASQSFTGAFAVRSGQQGQPVHQARVVYSQKRVAPGETLEVTTRLFAGAKEMGALRDYQYLFDGKQEPAGFFGKFYDFLFYSGQSRFTDAIDWGWFAFLTRPIFEILAALNAWVGNMGVAIILLTLTFKLLLFPLAHKAYVSMSKMKKLQPEMQKIQERYKDDRMEMQKEMMALYKREKANPAAGCVPILLQIPIFFSLYKVLFVTLEIRHAPFFGWIQDLSAPDPTSILNLFGILPWPGGQDIALLSILAIGFWPVVMGVSMWIQQMLNPAPTDPVQAQVFAIMPLLFTFMLGHFASGLVIYWTANNLFTIAQQYTIMKSQGVDVDIIGNMKRQLGLAPKESGG